jgi:hypothetical protein
MMVHSLHPKMYALKKYYSPNENCTGELCGKKCEQYQTINCQRRMRVITAPFTHSLICGLKL